MSATISARMDPALMHLIETVRREMTKALGKEVTAPQAQRLIALASIKPITILYGQRNKNKSIDEMIEL